MIKNTLKFSLLFILIATAIACKDKKIEDPINPTTPALNSLFESIKEEPQVFTFSAGQYITIEGNGGTKLHFNPNSFLDQNDNIISTGNIKIELIEALNASQMLRNRVFTMTQQDQLLTSGGAIHIKATRNDQAIKANYYAIDFDQTEDNASLMALYKGFEQTLSGGPAVMWYDDTTNTTSITRKENPQGMSEYWYAFDSVTSFNWINCDYFYSYPDPKTNIGIVLPDASFNNDNTEVYVSVKSINALFTMNGFNEGSNTFIMHSSNYFLPVGLNVEIMVLAEKNGKYYMFNQKNVSIISNLTINATMTEANAAEIVTAISSM